MLGTATDAEDVLQEAHLRFSQRGTNVQHPKRWLEQVVTRLCIDELKSARARREEYVGPWLPEPLETVDATLDGEHVDRESISLAFLTLLERLSPLERAEFVLVELFEYSADEAASALGGEAPAMGSCCIERAPTLRPPSRASLPLATRTWRFWAHFSRPFKTGDVKSGGNVSGQGRTRYHRWGHVKTAPNVIVGADRLARFAARPLDQSRPKASAMTSAKSTAGRRWSCSRAAVVSGVALETDGVAIFGVSVCRNASASLADGWRGLLRLALDGAAKSSTSTGGTTSGGITSHRPNARRAARPSAWSSRAGRSLAGGE